MLPCGVYKTSYLSDNAIAHTPVQWGWLIAFLIFLYVVAPLTFSSTTLGFMTNTSIFIIAVLGLNLLTGMAGQISLGQAAFMGVGAYTTAILMKFFSFSFWLALPCSGAVAGFVGLVFGLPSLRCKGFYLAMATLAAQFIFTWTVTHSGPVTGAFDGIGVSKPGIGSLSFESTENFYLLTLVITTAMVFFAKNISRTKSGKIFMAIRDNDLSAAVLGINVFRHKMIAFSACSFYAGIAGSLYGANVAWINPDHFNLMGSIWMLGMLLIGGMGSIVGVVTGVLFVQGLNELAVIGGGLLTGVAPSMSNFFLGAGTNLVFGLAVLLFLIFEPRGINHRWELFKASYRLHPFSY